MYGDIGLAESVLRIGLNLAEFGCGIGLDLAESGLARVWSSTGQCPNLNL